MSKEEQPCDPTTLGSAMTDAIENEDLNSIYNDTDPAEGIRDPLDGLVERTASDPGAPFTPQVLERLVVLRGGNRAAYEALRVRLKKAGCRVAALDQAVAKVGGDIGRRSTQADNLINLAGAAVVFHDPNGLAYADIEINGHRETWPVRNKGFRRWLVRQFFEATRGAPNAEALQSALNVIEAKAQFDGPERPVFIRVGDLDGRLYLDLGDEAWRAVEISAHGWRVIDKPPVRFRRPAGMQPLPIPEERRRLEAELWKAFEKEHPPRRGGR